MKKSCRIWMRNEKNHFFHGFKKMFETFCGNCTTLSKCLATEKTGSNHEFYQIELS